MRGILAEHHGLDIESVHWRTGGLEQAGRQEKSRVRSPERPAALGDVFDYGVGPNQAALSAILRYAHEQGFTSRLLESTDLFVPTTRTDAKV